MDAFFENQGKGYRKSINTGLKVIKLILEFGFAQLLCFALCSSLTVLFFYDEFPQYVLYLVAVNIVSFAIVLIKTYTSVQRIDISK